MVRRGLQAEEEITLGLVRRGGQLHHESIVKYQVTSVQVVAALWCGDGRVHGIELDILEVARTTKYADCRPFRHSPIYLASYQLGRCLH